MKKLSELFKKSEKNEQKSNHKAEVNEKAKSLSDDEYGDEETYSNSEFSVGFEFNKPDKDWTIDGGPGMKNEKQFYEGTTPGTGLSLPNPSVYDGLVIK